MRKLLQAHLDLHHPGKAMEPVRDAAGTPLTPTPAHTAQLGKHFRDGGGDPHWLSSRKTSPVLHPLDGALNLPSEKYSLEVRRRVAIEAAKGAFDEGVKTLEEFPGAHVPKRQFEELVIRAAQVSRPFTPIARSALRADPHSGSVLVLTVDGKGAVMRPEDLREATQRAAAKQARLSRHGWGAVVGCTAETDGLRWPLSIPSSASSARPRKFCHQRRSSRRSQPGHSQNINTFGPASPTHPKQ